MARKNNNSSNTRKNSGNRKKTVNWAPAAPLSRGVAKRRPRNLLGGLDGVNFEGLETRQLMSTVNVSDYGATVNNGGNDTNAIQAAINASHAGDTINFGAGTYDLSGELNIPGDRTLQGNGNAKLAFHNGSGTFGLKLDGNVANVTINGFDITGGAVNLGGGSYFRNIKITNNRIQANGTPGVNQTVGSDGLVIENNTFHDYNDYGAIIWYANHMSFQRNTFLNINQGAHILSAQDDCKVSFNKATGLTRMMFEVQRHGDTITRNLTVEGNVAYDWKSPFRDSFGLSIVPDGSINTRVINNYLRANIGPGGSWNPVTATDGQGQRFGYGIEYGAASGEVSGNVIGGAFINYIIGSGGNGSNFRNISVTGNQFYGRPVWTDYISTEAGGVLPSSMSELLQRNPVNQNLLAMPGAPTTAGAGSNGSTTPTNPTPPPDTGSDDPDTGDNGDGGSTPTDKTFGATVSAVNTQKLLFTFRNLPAGATKVRIDSISTVGRDTGDEVGPNGTILTIAADGTVQLAGFHPGWKIDVRATILSASGAQLAQSGWVTQQMSGDPTVAWPAQGGGGTKTPVPVDPTPTTKKTYIGELDPTVVINGYGLPEINRSNGERGANDGNPITLNGKSYKRGIGVHAGSELHYELDGAYSTFVSNIGIDEEVGNLGSVVFQVWADGTKLYESSKITGNSANQTISVNVAGKSELWLVVTDAGDGKSYDHADWANAYLLKGGGVSAKPIAVGNRPTTAAGSGLRLTELADGQEVTTVLPLPASARLSNVRVGGVRQVWAIVEQTSTRKAA